MKKLFFISLYFSTTIFFVAENVMGMRMVKDESFSSLGQQQTVSFLEKAFNEIADIPKMEAMPEVYLKEMYPAELGATRCVVYGNSEPREAVLGILNRIPKIFFTVMLLMKRGGRIDFISVKM